MKQVLHMHVSTLWLFFNPLAQLKSSQFRYEKHAACQVLVFFRLPRLTLSSFPQHTWLQKLSICVSINFWLKELVLVLRLTDGKHLYTKIILQHHSNYQFQNTDTALTKIFIRTSFCHFYYLSVVNFRGVGFTSF